MENPAAGTAIGPMVIVAIDRRDPRPLTQDELAARFLPDGTRRLVALARWRPLGQWIFRLTENRMPGLWAGMLCRKRYIDDQALDAAEAGLDAAVILGAGMDTRAYRLPPLERIPVYEIDLARNIARKRDRLRRLYGTVPDHVRLVAIDFETEDPAAELAAAGYPATAKTLFVWEAVTQYLAESSVRAIFEFLAKAPAGSRLVFTYVRRDFLDGTAMFGAEAMYRDFVVKNGLWKFGLHPSQVAGFLAEYGWRVTDHAGPPEFTDRYLRPSGRDLPVSEIERAVTAEKI